MFAHVEMTEEPCSHGAPAWLCEDVCPEFGLLGEEPALAVVDAAAVDPAQVPGARLALQCESAAAVPELLSDGEVLDVVEGAEKLLRWASGLRTRMLATFADRHPAGSCASPPGADTAHAAPVDRWLPDEVGLTLAIPRLEALSEIARARRFAHVLPDTLAALEHGRIDERRADAIARATAVLPDDTARAVEAAVLPKAPDATLRQVRDRVRRAIARIDPDGQYRRHRAANTERRVSIRSLDDGMASLWFYGSAEQIEAAWQMADRLARALGPDDPRTLDQRRVDLAMRVLTGRLTVTDLADVDTAVTATLTGNADAADADGTESTSRDPGDTAETGTDARAGSASGTEPDDPEGPDAPNLPDDEPDGLNESGGLDEPSTSDVPNGPDGPSGTTAAPPAPADPDDRAPVGYRVPPDMLTDAVAHALTQRSDLHATVRAPLIHVVVGLDTLLGDDRPAELVGHGPLAAQTARALAAGGVWKRLVTDPLSGTLLDHGRTTYTPPTGLGDHVRARDQICRGPHCGRRIQDLDHHQAWAAHHGPTADHNLYGYCRHHHKLKDAPGWNVIAHPDRTLTWISPCGRRHTTHPHDHRPYTDPRATGDPAATSAPATGDATDIGSSGGDVVGKETPPF